MPLLKLNTAAALFILLLPILAAQAVEPWIEYRSGSTPATGWQVQGTATAPVLSHSVAQIPSFANDPSKAEWSFEVKLRISGEPIATNSAPYLLAGLRDEGGGKTVMLAFWRDAAGQFRLSVHDEKRPALRVNLSAAAKQNADFRDGKFHTFRIVKELGRGNLDSLRVVFYVDGVRWPAEKFGSHYEKGFTPAPTSDVGAQVLVPREQQAQVEVAQLALGPSEFVLPADAPATPPVVLKLKTSQMTERQMLTPDAHYELTAQVLNRGAVSVPVRLKVQQSAKGADEPNLPDFFSAIVTLQPDAQPQSITLPFYVRRWSPQVQVTVECDAAAVELKSAAVVGGSRYTTRDEPVRGEDVPPLTDALRAQVRARPNAEAWLEQRAGRTRLVVNGEPLPPSLYIAAPGPPRTGLHTAFAKAGVRIHGRVVHLGYDEVNPQQCWSGPGKFDFASIKEQLWRVLRADPQAYLWLMVFVDPYAAWGSEHPDEVCRNEAGVPAVGQQHMTRWDHAPKDGKERLLPSLYSQKVRTDCAEAMRQLVRALDEDADGLGRCVIGYATVGFNDGQFVNWAHWDTKHMDDYSPTALREFRAWLRRRYHEDTAALRSAWQQPEITFETALIPPPQRRLGSSSSLFADWQTHGDVADFHRFYVEAPIETIEACAKAVKDSARGRKLVSTYYASLLNAANSGSGLARVLASPYLDVLHCPAHYWQRLPGYPGGSQSASGSVALHGKIFLTEQDWRSWLSVSAEKSIADFTVGRAPDAWSMTQMVRRESGMMLASGQGTWWFELSHGAFRDPQIMAGIAEARAAFEQDLSKPGLPATDVAFFAGESSLDHLAQSALTKEYRWYLLRHHRDKWSKSGVPYQVYLQSDLTHPKLPEFKVYVFLLPQHITESERRAIEALKRGGKTLVFLHAPGIIGAADPAAAISRITGITTTATAQPVAYAGSWAEGSDPLLQNLSGAILPLAPANTAGSTVFTAPAFEITDPAATPLAVYAGSSRVAIATRDFGAWRSVYCALPQLEPQFLHNLATTAGAWCATAPYEVVYASQHFLTIHALAPGLKTLTLRQPSKVTDLTTGEVISESTTHFTIEMPFGETRWFSTEAK